MESDSIDTRSKNGSTLSSGFIFLVNSEECNHEMWLSNSIEFKLLEISVEAKIEWSWFVRKGLWMICEWANKALFYRGLPLYFKSAHNPSIRKTTKFKIKWTNRAERIVALKWTNLMKKCEKNNPRLSRNAAFSREIASCEIIATCLVMSDRLRWKLEAQECRSWRHSQADHNKRGLW